MDDLRTRVQKMVNNIYQHHGHVKASELVESARPKSSPIHDAFLWDDKKAGQEYRLWQARQWIRRVEIIIEDRPEQVVHVPLITINGSNEGVYKPISVVISNPKEYSACLSEALRRLASARRAIDDLEEASRAARITKVDFGMINNCFQTIETGLQDRA